MSDPILKQAVLEIAEILRKHDIAAVVHLQSRTHGEYYYHLSPTWSCASLSEQGEFRFKAAVKTGGPVEKERGRVTTGMILGFMDAAIKQQRDMEQVALMLGKHMEITHTTRYEDPP
jgi:hypothetical protein